MRSETLNFLGGLLVFLAALVPILRALWTTAAARGTGRTFVALGLTFLSCVLTIVFLAGRWFGLSLSGHAILLHCIALLYVVTFLIDPETITRRDTALLAGLLFLVGSMLSLIYIAMASQEAAAKRTKSLPDDPPLRDSASP